MTQINVQIFYSKKASIISKLIDVNVYVRVGIFGLFHGRHFKTSLPRCALIERGL